MTYLQRMGLLWFDAAWPSFNAVPCILWDVTIAIPGSTGGFITRNRRAFSIDQDYLFILDRFSARFLDRSHKLMLPITVECEQPSRLPG